MKSIRCVHDLIKSSAITSTGRFGYFEVVFDDSTVSLKASSLEEAEKWVNNLKARKEYFQGHGTFQTIHKYIQNKKIQKFINTDITPSKIISSFSSLLLILPTTYHTYI